MTLVTALFNTAAFNGNNKIDPPPWIWAEKIAYDNPWADQIKQIIWEINGKPADGIQIKI